MSGLIEQYTNLIKRLLPIGLAWEKVRDYPLWSGIAVEACRIDDRINDLLDEIDPGNADELLDDWLNLVGLPDDCTPDDITDDELKVQARQKLGTLNGQTAIFLEGVCEKLGFENVEITDAPIGRSGLIRSGDQINPAKNDSRCLSGTCRSGDELTGAPGWQFVFFVDLEATDITDCRSGQCRSGDRIRNFENPLLECTINKLKPAHTQAVFRFQEP